MWAELKPNRGESSFRLSWQQSRYPLTTLCLGFKILLCHLSNRTDAESNRQTCKKNQFAHKQEKSKRVDLTESGEATRLRNWPACLSEWRAPFSLSLCRWAETQDLSMTHRKKASMCTARQQASVINVLPLAWIASSLFSWRFLPISVAPLWSCPGLTASRVQRTDASASPWAPV